MVGTAVAATDNVRPRPRRLRAAADVFADRSITGIPVGTTRSEDAAIKDLEIAEDSIRDSAASISGEPVGAPTKPGRTARIKRAEVGVGRDLRGGGAIGST